MPKEDTQFKAGQSGNPNGRPKKEYCLTDILKEQGETEDVQTSNGQKISRKNALGQKLWAMAMGGDITAMRYVYDRIDGKPNQTIDTTIKKDTNMKSIMDKYKERKAIEESQKVVKKPVKRKRKKKLKPI